MGKSETFRDKFTTRNADGVFNIFPAEVFVPKNTNT